MKKAILLVLVVSMGILSACSDKKKEGRMVYHLDYTLPDSLKSYAAYLPAEAVIYFKGDSAVTIQKAGNESTTIITYKPTGFMQVLLTSATRHYVIDYSKADQDEEQANMPTFNFTPTNGSRNIAGLNAKAYTMHDKLSGDSTEAWFTHDIVIPQNALTAALNTNLGVPLIFSANQNGIITKTSVKEIKLEAVPDGVFSVPTGYTHLTPKQLKDMPVE